MALAKGQPGEDWFQGPDGGWLPPDRKPKTSPNFGGGLFDIPPPPGETAASPYSMNGPAAYAAGMTGTGGTGASGSASGTAGTGGTDPLPASSPSPVDTGSPGAGWFKGPDGGWLPPDRAAEFGAGTGTTGTGGTTAGTGTTGTGTATGAGAAGTGVTAGTAGAATGASTSTAKTITINGKTYTIPGGDVDTSASGATATTPAASAAGLNYSPEDPMLGLVREQLVNLMGRANATPSLTDPTLRPAAQAYAVAQQRARQGLQNENAEALSARGYGSSGAADQALAQSYERMGENTGRFNAELLTGEQTARRADLQSALGMANQLGMFKEKTALERDLATLDVQTKTNLANLDSQLRMAGLTVQERLGIMDAELKKYGIDLQGNMALLDTVLKNEFNYAQLQVQAGIANLDASVKMQLSQLDAQLRREGYSTQERLAALDAEVRKYGIQTSGDLGALDVALRRELGIGSLNLGLLNTLLQNQQFNDTLGWDMGKWAGNQNAGIINLLGGGG